MRAAAATAAAAAVESGASVNEEILAGHGRQIDVAQASLGQLEAKLQALESSQSESVRTAAAAMDSLKTTVAQIDTEAAEARQCIRDDQSLISLIDDRLQQGVAAYKGLCTGDRCEVNTESCRGVGIVRFVGRTAFKAGIWVGVQLDQPHGKNDGSVQGQRYFSCEDNYGVFTAPENIRKVTVVEIVAGALDMERQIQEADTAKFREAQQKIYEAHTAQLATLDDKWGSRCNETAMSVQEFSSKLKTEIEQMEVARRELARLEERFDAAKIHEIETLIMQKVGGVLDGLSNDSLGQMSVLQTQVTELASDVSNRSEVMNANIAASVASRMTAYEEQIQAGERQHAASIEQLRGEVAGLKADTGKDLEAVMQQRIEALDERNRAHVAQLDTRLTAKLDEANQSFDAGQDAYEKRVDALESWLLQVEEKLTSVEQSAASTLDAFKAEMHNAVSSCTEGQRSKLDALGSEIAVAKNENTQLLRKLANGIKAEIDTIKSEMESTETKVLGFLKKHAEFSEQKIGNNIGRDEYDEFVAESTRRTAILEERVDMTLSEARSQVTATEKSVVQLRQQWNQANQQAERKQEPLYIRVPGVTVRHADGNAAKP